MQTGEATVENSVEFHQKTKNEIRPPTHTTHQDKIKMDKRLKHSCDTIKVLEENIGRKISDISHSNIFTNTSSRRREIKERINKWDFIKLKSFCTAKQNISNMKREPAVQENIFAYLPMIPQKRV